MSFTGEPLHASAPPGTGAAETPATPSLRIFINYRRADTPWIARALHDRLAQRFGADNVFLDVDDLADPGLRWRDELRSRGAAAEVLIALVGSKWTDILRDRQAKKLTEPDEVQREIELALSRGSGIEIIPVVVDDAAMPKATSLPPSLRGLTDHQDVRLHAGSFNQDVDRLITKLEDIARRPPPSPQPVVEVTPPPSEADAADDEPQIAEPHQQHYRDVRDYLIQGAAMTTVLGPQAGRLSAGLPAHFARTPPGLDLAEAAQRVFVVSGRPDLYRELKQTLSTYGEPSAVHRFLAQLPAKLERLGVTRRYQLIVTSNYDNELERAFDAEQEPYDLAVYMSSGSDRGRFVHFPFQSAPEAIASPNDYNGFPIDVETGELQRTVIVKIHGAVDGGSGGYVWRENYVITEDHYIDYLSTQPVECFVPAQILTRLRDSHCLFLGYPIRDWSLRVFIKRIWSGQPLDTDSWAVQQGPEVLDRKLWSHIQVDLFASVLDEYVERLEACVTASGTRSG